MEVNSHRSLSSRARIMVREERSRGKAGEIDDESQEQDFAAERRAVPGSPKSVQPEDQPTGNGDRAQDKKRKGKRAVRKKRKEKFGDHIGRDILLTHWGYSVREECTTHLSDFHQIVRVPLVAFFILRSFLTGFKAVASLLDS